MATEEDGFPYDLSGFGSQIKHPRTTLQVIWSLWLGSSPVRTGGVGTKFMPLEAVKADLRPLALQGVGLLCLTTLASLAKNGPQMIQVLGQKEKKTPRKSTPKAEAMSVCETPMQRQITPFAFWEAF